MDRTHTDLPTQHLHGIGELLQAVPYLLGFHPRDSLVVVGLAGRVLVVTARLDLADVPASIDYTVEAMARGGCTALFAALYAPPPAGDYDEVARVVSAAADAYRCRLLDVVLHDDGRWWSLDCPSLPCCPPEGRLVPLEPTAFTVAATVDGVVALPDRADVAAQLDPRPPAELAALEPALAEAEHAGVRAALDGTLGRHERSVKRAIFAAARASDEAPEGGWPPPDGETVARFGAALSVTELRDAIWLAIDDGRLDGRVLWRELACRLPPPYSAAPLFLYGWASWRAGNATLAGMAAHRALSSDPGYGAGELLLAAVGHGMDPRRVPRLRSGRVRRAR